MRLIDADLLGKDGFTVQTQEYGSVDVVSLDCIADAPTVEAAPVVHGRWILSSTDMQCPECKTVYEIDMYSPICAETAHYCPNCAAKMDL